MDTFITQAPSGAVDTFDATVVFQGAGPVTGFECRLDSGAFATCVSPVNLMALQEGAHAFEVRALGAGGQVDTTPATASWTVVPPAPDTVAVGGPTGETNTMEATFVFAGTGSFASFECALDAASFTPCTSPHVENNVAPGQHTFAVAAVGASGARDPSPATWTWTVLEVGPPTHIDSFPVFVTSNTSAEFRFSSVDGGATFECSLDGAAFTACTSPQVYGGLSDGPHTFSVRAVDSMGVADPSPATEMFTVDTIPPVVTITVRPPAVTASTLATFEFTSNEANASFQCRLDGGSFNFCYSPHTLQTLSEGNHTLDVMARDNAYNASEVVTVRWLVDLPATRLTQEPPAVTALSTVTFGFMSPNRVDATFECSLDGAAFSACLSPFTIEDLQDGVHDFKVRAVGVDGMDPSPARHVFARRGTGVIQLATRRQLGMMCALEGGGRAWCFGEATGSATPLVLPGPYRSISVAGSYSGPARLCGVRQDGGLECGIPGQAMVPVDPQLNWLSVSVSEGHACGIKEGNVLVCWGDNFYGALGLGSTVTDVAVPTAVGLPGWTHVATSSSGTCAVRGDGTLWCWGSDWRDWNDPNGDIWVPVQAGTSQDWQRLTVSNGTVCGWRTDGALWCRGGLGGYASLEPVDGRGVLAVDGAYSAVFLLNANGSLRVEGYSFGAAPILGDATVPDWMMDALVFPARRFVTVASVGESACAVEVTGGLVCWGSNRSGLLGQGFAGRINTPAPVPGLPASSQVFAGGMSVCAQSATGDVTRCWGDNAAGQLGLGDVAARAQPAVLAPQGVTFAQVSQGRFAGCGVGTNGSLWCWGDASVTGGGFETRPAPVRLGTDADWSHVETGGTVACATKTDQTLWCWGDNYDGATGLGMGITFAGAPTRTSLSGVTTFSLQATTACAITMDGALYCWGENFWRQTGIPVEGDVMEPTRVGAAAWRAVSASTDTTCGIRTSGALYCWGLSGASPELEPVGNALDWRAIHGAGNNRCAINAAGQAFCWGDNTHGQAGVGMSGQVFEPTLVAGGHTWLDVNLGDDFACGVTTGNTVMCWGSNHLGQLGDGHGMSYAPLPVAAP